jgi:LEA14-like dessication related protein
MKLKSKLFAVVVLPAVLLAAACSALRPEPPQVALESVRLSRFNLKEQEFNLILRVKNPNGRDFVLSALSYNIEVGGKPFAHGLSGQRVLLAANGETLVELPGVARAGGVFGSLLDGLVDGEIEYRVFGYADFEGFGRLPFDKKRKAPVRL